MSNRKKVTLAVVGSVLLHLLIILSVSGINAVWPQTDTAEAKPETESPQLTLLDSPPAQQQERQYVRTNEDQKTDQDPVDSMFESDKDTAAASEQDAKGRAPLPTQDGKEIPDLAFRNEDYSLDTLGSQFSEKPSTAQSQLEAPTPTPTVVLRLRLRRRQKRKSWLCCALNQRLRLHHPRLLKTRPRNRRLLLGPLTASNQFSTECRVTLQTEAEPRLQRSVLPGADFKKQCRMLSARGGTTT